MKIINAHSTTLSGGKALAPESGRLEYGEIGINYSSQDPSLFVKDDSDNIVKISSDEALSNIFESKENKVSAYTENLTDEQYPSAKLVFDVIKENEEIASSALNDLNERVSDNTIIIEGFGSRIGSCETEIAGIKEDYAKKEDIPSLDDYYTKDDLTGTDGIITKNERVVSTALVDLDERIIEANTEIEGIKEDYAKKEDFYTKDDLTGENGIITKNEKVTSTALVDLNDRIIANSEAIEGKADIEGVQSMIDESIEEYKETVDANFEEVEEIVSTALNDLNGRIGRIENNYVKSSDITKQFLLNLLGATEETLTFIDESGNTSEKKVIVLN